MRKLLLSLALLGIGSALLAQNSNRINLNNIEAHMSSNGSLFQTANAWGMFMIKDDQYKTAVFAASLWLSAYSGDTNYTAAQDYYLAGNANYANSDYRFGPIANDYSLSSYNQEYDRVWQVSKQEIQDHQSLFADPSYQAPKDLLEWPAHGDTLNGEAAHLAPFQDLNANKIYEPLLGEYPIIRGDQCLYAIFNDDSRHNPVSNISSAQLEIHVMLCAFQNPILPELRNSLFLNYKIHNRSDRNYDSIQVSLWNDTDLGNSGDDIIGSDASLGMAYVYNADSLDEGNGGFGIHPPAVGTRFLNGQSQGSQYFHNTWGFTGPTALINPLFGFQYEMVLNNHWIDGQPIRVEDPSGKGSMLNGDGWDTLANTVNPITTWAYDDQENWFCSPANLSDKRQLISHKDFSLNAGEKICIDALMSYARDSSSHDPFAAVLKLKTEQNLVEQYFDNQNFDCNSYQLANKAYSSPKAPSLYPNPTGDFIQLDYPQRKFPAEIEIRTINGQTLRKLILESSDQSIDVKDLSPGMYILQILDDDAQAFNLPFIRA